MFEAKFEKQATLKELQVLVASQVFGTCKLVDDYNRNPLMWFAGLFHACKRDVNIHDRDTSPASAAASAWFQWLHAMAEASISPKVYLRKF